MFLFVKLTFKILIVLGQQYSQSADPQRSDGIDIFVCRIYVFSVEKLIFLRGSPNYESKMSYSWMDTFLIHTKRSHHRTYRHQTFPIPCFPYWLQIDTFDCKINIWQIINTLRPRQNGRHLPDDIFKWIFLNENVWISIDIPLTFVPRGPVNNIPTLVQVMAWRRPGDKPLSEPTHICVTRPQWVNCAQAKSNPSLRIHTECSNNLGYSDETFPIFSCDQAALQMVFSVCLSVRLSVCPSVRLSVTPFWLCSHHRIIMKFSGVITNDQRKVHAKGQGQRSKVKVTEVTTQLNRFRTVTPVWIHIWWWNDAYSLMLVRRGALLFFKVIRQISRSHGSKNRRIWPRLGVSGL